MRRISYLLLATFFFLAGSGAARADGCFVTYRHEFMTTAGSGPTQTLTVVTFGTSVTWGDELHEEHTFRYGVSDWLARTTGRTVNLWTFAHSASYLKTVANQGDSSPDPGNGALKGNNPRSMNKPRARPGLSTVWERLILSFWTAASTK
jgi:hypothetical protein